MGSGVVECTQPYPCFYNRAMKMQRGLSSWMRSPFSRPSRGNDQMAACGRLGNPGTIQAPMLRVPKQFQMAVGRHWMECMTQKLGLLEDILCYIVDMIGPEDISHYEMWKAANFLEMFSTFFSISTSSSRLNLVIRILYVSKARTKYDRVGPFCTQGKENENSYKVRK
ncbi:unnamed protein product [Vicia faba]|uniref:Uncharacterized protein n=1 Tax=Vicia faba TaxID=3906 RepID=A0AAV0YNZ6_VICFA|nr:unnamed protein product [Vicia faba]